MSSDAVLVIGGGIAGIRVTLDLAKAGAQVILVERGPTIGGKMSAPLDEDTPPLDVFGGMTVPKMQAVLEHDNIEVLSLTDVVGLSGEPTNFTVTLRQRARYVTDACTQCNVCRQVCPMVQPNEFDSGLAFRKAIYSPLKNSVPKTYVIDIDSCLNTPPNYLACQRCVEVCESNCIDFDMPAERTFERQVGAVVVATGFDLLDPTPLTAYGYGQHPDVLTSMELERLLSSTGPTGGYLEKPSNEEEPESVLIILCDTSRFAWGYSARHTARLVDQDITDVTLLYPDRAAFGEGFDEFWQETAGEGVKLVWGQNAKVEILEGDKFRVEYTDGETGQKQGREYDMVVLTVPVGPAEGMAELAEVLGIDLDANRYVKLVETRRDRTTTSRRAIYVAGCAIGLRNMPACLVDAKEASANAMRYLEKNGRSERVERRDDQPAEPVEPVEALVQAVQGLPQEELQTAIERVVQSLLVLGQK